MPAARTFAVIALLTGLTGLCRCAEPDESGSIAGPKAAGQPADEVNSMAEGRYFRVATSVDKTTLEAEERVTLTVRISTSEAPYQPPQRFDLNDIPAFASRFFIQDAAPDPTDAVRCASLWGLGNEPLLLAAALAPQTEWVFVYRLKPRDADVTEIPMLTFAFYDPVDAVDTPQRRWQVPHADAIPLHVRTRRAITTPVEAPEWMFDLPDGDVLARIEPWSPGLVAWTVLLAGPPLVGIGLFLVWRRLNPNAARLAQVRRSHAARRALDRIAQARKAPPDRRADEIAAAVAGFLRERFDFPAEEPTPSEVGHHLGQGRCSAATAKQAEEFFQKSDAARFLPDAGTDGLAEDAERLIVALEDDGEATRDTRRSRGLASLGILLVALVAAPGALPLSEDDALEARAVRAFVHAKESRNDADKARPQFREAARLWERAHRQLGASNPLLYRYVGNAHLLGDELGQAILAYRRGLRLAPHDHYLRAGLDQARRRVAYPGDKAFGRPPADPGPLWPPTIAKKWLFAAALVAFLIGWGFVARWLMKRSLRPLGLAVLFLALGGGAAACLVLTERAEQAEKARPLVVIIDDGVLLLKGDGEAFPPRYDTTVNRGVEARLLFERNGWLQIELTGGEVGWIATKYAVVDRS